MAPGNIRILVVDDDALMREAFAEGLSQYGYECVTVGSAYDADRALQREAFSLMLLDIGMPGKSGLELLPDVAERYPDMSIVMVTGHDELNTAVLAMREGAHDYITKPVSLAPLIFRVEQVLARRALLLEIRAYREELERMVHELNLRLEQSKRELGALNNLVQSYVTAGETTSEAYTRLQSAVTAFNSGFESLADLAEGINLGADDTLSPH